MNPIYEVRFSKSARRALSHDLPEPVAIAAFEFIMGAIRDNPHGVGKQLREPLFPQYSARRGDYRVIYRIIEQRLVIDVISVTHRGNTHRRA
ncbi:type II toxin-antitoxin system RelE/ParE family toxin [Arthrobacter sp. H5]|uniref:type II toxin-antitoxin system RelE family toxin n=1 Tax=Arthrobacter sp. H5 TaxID=1267973 RepID=UPI0004880BB3|nr:type II toxin-antitoxin system RelE/ParE family toxin [Arthrobacter sp. H5]